MRKGRQIRDREDANANGESRVSAGESHMSSVREQTRNSVAKSLPRAVVAGGIMLMQPEGGWR